VALFKFGGLFTLSLIVLWGVWHSLRSTRESLQIIFLLVMSFTACNPVYAQEQEADSKDPLSTVTVDDILGEAEVQQVESPPSKEAAPVPKAKPKPPELPAKTEAKKLEETKKTEETKTENSAAEVPKVEPATPIEVKIEAVSKPVVPTPPPPQPMPKVKIKRKEKLGFPKPENFPPPVSQNKTGNELPKYLSGFELKDITSCLTVDTIPWKFRPDRRKTRLLLKDRLRHQSQTTFSEWSVFQVMDGDGFVSYVFRRPLSSGRNESMVVKDTVYNRVLDTARGPKTVESQDLRTLINRPALTFYHQDGSTVTYSPSSVGRSALVIQQAQTAGRLLPPVFLRGNFCDRPDDDEDADKASKQLAAPKTGATGTGGAN